MKRIIEGKVFSKERDLYGLSDVLVLKCNIAGEEDGESALKECKNIEVDSCNFELRYPMWHDENLSIKNSTFTKTCRAPIWYSKNVSVENCNIDFFKGFRECENINVSKSKIISEEVFWRCKKIKIEDSSVEGSYPFFESKNISFNRCNLKGKYSFEYVENMTISDSSFDTKDAFWHSKNVTIKDSVIVGEYLGWYSENLTLINCKIIGTQPLCYCKKLKLINCTMDNCDLSFEYSDVKATINGKVLSVKNPLKGSIIADDFGEILFTDDAVKKCVGKVIKRKN